MNPTKLNVMNTCYVSSELFNYIRKGIHIRKNLLYTLFTELCPLRHYG